MDCHRGSGFYVTNVVGLQSGNSGNSVNDNWGLRSIDKADCDAEDGICNKKTSVHTNLISNYNGSSFQLEVEGEPPNKRAKNYLSEDLTTFDHKKGTGTVLYKTKLCYQFRAGSCPFIENCDFAHSMEELRELPHNWQEIVAAHKEELVESLEQPREAFQIPVMGLNEETQGPNLRQQCKGFISGVGCQYGKNCIFMHNEHYNERRSAAICLLPGPGGGCERSGSKSSLGNGGGYESNVSKLTSNTSNWKTRVCYKWESTGCCPYGRKCIFAHGYAELQHYAGRLMNREAVDSSTFIVPAKASVGTVGAPVSLVPYSYHVGVPSRRLPAETPMKRWKGPNKISKIYGDWIDDLE
ncbi:hypothetical protein C2S51_004470 [Perilla frutescens var. frutescens]|nr:hypothetical protein C2S51_004470 [Perilla frutescens var. frutescens]